MRNTMNLKNITLLFLLTVNVAFVRAQITPADKLPVDTAVTIGKLPNGLTYYIRPNNKPEQKVELRLVVNAGSINEDADQLGLAHMAEHMAFNGTKNFKKNDIISFLQNIGVGFGSDLNAYTSFDETVYILPIPTDKPDNLEKGFSVLEDWAHNVTYLDEDIDNERAIILEESRSGKGAGERMFKKILPKLLSGSLYAERLPIGNDSIIKNFTHDAIRRFYKDWYRPELMAVIVVGDITKEKATALIKKHFGSLTNPATVRPRQSTPVPPYATNDALVVTDKEATSYQAIVEFPAYPSEKIITYNDYRKDLVKDLFVTMLNKRMQELTQKENPPFVYGGGSFSGFARGYENFELYAVSGDKEPTGALQAALEELEKVKRFGFTAPELERAKKNMLATYEKNYNDRDKRESSNFVQEYIQHYLQQSPIPGIATEYKMTQDFLPAISLQEVNAVAGILKGDQHLFAFIMGPQKEDVQLPSPQALLQTVTLAEKADVKPYEEKAVATEILSALPKAGKVTGKKNNAATGTTELTLSNGITVTLKATDFKNDEILMSASRYGGTSNYRQPDKYNAAYAIPVVNAMGFGNFSPTDLQKALSGKTVSATPFIGGTTEGINGSSTVKDLETMFQLAYLKLTQPRTDSSLFKSYVQKNQTQLALLGSNPQAAFIDTAFRVFYNNNPLAPIHVPKAAYFDSIQINRTIDIYKQRLGDAGGLHFVFTGNFKEAEIIPFIETYIASLPATLRKSNYVDQHVRPIQGKRALTVYKGEEQKSLILSFYYGDISYSEDLAFKANALTEVLNIRIIEELREKIQGIYGGGIFGRLNKAPYPSFQFVAQLPCGPEKADTLLKALQNEINNIVKNGPDAETLNKVKQQWRESHKQEMKENGPWSAHLLAAKVEGENIDRFIHFEKYIDQLTPKDVQEAARLLLNGKNNYTAILMPADAKKE
ncbi:insulinase family protein [Agriterribacter sp.]|uniref:M16 family metallopeptidase n=1 Tax=Agriterribacter sp. TaxID=2821509 RepID=UPI002BD938AA|nr:insulinase family protein [Agriterribacter sp.]HRO47478.1 insulinase family protein [Agriterribacter sp.]HRQ18607.1 insulinase family protein [Agriterribacter sp.]